MPTMVYKKITIVTPNFNGAEYLEETIKSVLNQNYPNLEYIVIDGGSSDGSIEIIKKYEKQLAYWVSEPDNGLYYALQKGLEKSSGEIMGWINSDDLLHPKSLFTLNEIFNLSPTINWVQGLPTFIDEKGKTIATSPQRQWSKYQFWMGDYKWIQQESTYWKRDLWNKSGAYISLKYKYAGDLELWSRFFKYEKLCTFGGLIGGFRMRSSNQLSLDNIEQYTKEAEAILQSIEISPNHHLMIKEIRRLKKLRLICQKSRLLNQVGLLRKLDQRIQERMSFPSQISFNQLTQRFEIY